MFSNMIQRIKKLTKLKGKKRYIVLGLLAVELMSLPAAAHIVHSAATSPQVRPIVTAVEVPTQEPGLSRFLILSNAGFGVQANNVVGDVSVNVRKSGVLNSVSSFGEVAQLPGPQQTCAQTSSVNSAIYNANRETSDNKGTAPQRAVMFEISYNPSSRPDFKFIAGSDKVEKIVNCS